MYMYVNMYNLLIKYSNTFLRKCFAVYRYCCHPYPALKTIFCYSKNISFLRFQRITCSCFLPANLINLVCRDFNPFKACAQAIPIKDCSKVESLNLLASTHSLHHLQLTLQSPISSKSLLIKMEN